MPGRSSPGPAMGLTNGSLVNMKISEVKFPIVVYMFIFLCFWGTNRHV